MLISESMILLLIIKKKMMKRKIFFLCVILVSLFTMIGCNEEEKSLDLNASADILSFTLGDRVGVIDESTRNITVSLPAGTDDFILTPTIEVSAGASVTPNSGEKANFASNVDYSVTIGNVYHNYTVSVDVLNAHVESFIVGDYDAIIDEDNLKILIPVTYGTDITSLIPHIVVSDESMISPASGISQDFTSSIEYILSSGKVSKTYQVSTVVEIKPNMDKGDIGSKLAFLGVASDSLSLYDDDEQAAADWFFTTYPTAEYISWDEVAGGAVNIYDYKVVWWLYDSPELPEVARNSQVSGLWSDYMKDGGNLLFVGQACKYFWNIERISSDFAMLIGNGVGFENNDTWTIGVNLPLADHYTHPLYNDIQFDVVDDFYTFPVLGAGWKEDHNHVMVEVAGHYGLANNDFKALSNFVQDLDAEWLGVWGGIRDYYMAGILELLPNEDFKGRAIYIGIGGFEWNQNPQGDINPDGINAYQYNINRVSKNAIDYLYAN